MLIVVRTGICDLPCELQDAIFAELCDPVDVFAFCLTASHFWRIGLPHYKALYMDYVRRAKDWSGDRLVCIGDSADDFPKGIFTPEDLEILADWYIDRHGEEAEIDYFLLSAFPDLRKVQWPARWAFTERCELKRWNPLARPVRPRKRISTLEADEPKNDLPLYLPLYKYNFSAWLELPEPSSSLDHAKPCILRNLSKKVYVRDDALALREDDANEDKDAKPYYMSFGSLVLLRIAWSHTLGLGTPHDDDLCQGIWTGDRFDIVNIDAIEHEEGWTDVSTAGREQLIQVWQAEFGASQWEAKVRKSGL